MTNYTVDYYINKFESIPEEEWCTDKITDNSGRHCALGHCIENDKETISLSELIWSNLGCSAATINDNHNKSFNQPTPKQRILAALKYIKNKASNDKTV